MLPPLSAAVTIIFLNPQTKEAERANSASFLVTTQHDRILELTT